MPSVYRKIVVAVTKTGQTRADLTALYNSMVTESIAIWKAQLPRAGYSGISTKAGREVRISHEGGDKWIIHPKVVVTVSERPRMVDFDNIAALVRDKCVELAHVDAGREIDEVYWKKSTEVKREENVTRG